MSWDPKKFAQSVAVQHRTLQQELMRTFVATIHVMASDDYGFDDRNRGSHEAAKNMVAAGVADEMLVQLSYAIGVAESVSIYVNTYGTSHVKESDPQIAQAITRIFDLRPHAIEQRLKLRQPIYEETAAYGHMGRTPERKVKTFHSLYKPGITLEVELFT